MAYDVIYMEGLEFAGQTVDVDIEDRFDFGNGSGAAFRSHINASGGPFGGAYVELNNGASAQDRWIWHQVTDTPQTTAFLSHYFYTNSISNGEWWALCEGMFGFGSEHINVVIDSGHAGITVRRGGGGGTIIATGAVTIPVNTWVHAETRVVISDTVGEVQVRINGAQVINVTGVDTKQGQTGGITTYAYQGNGGVGGVFNIAEIVMQGVNGDWLGRHRIRAYLPTASGAESDFTRVGGGTNNYEAVDDNGHDQDTTYNWSTTAGHRDRYAFTDPTFVGKAVAIGVKAIARIDEPGTAKLKVGLRSEGATEGLSAATEPRFSNHWRPIQHIIHNNPDDAQAFEATDLDGAEIVIEMA